MEKLNNENTTGANVLQRLENLSLKVENLDGMSHVCGVAFGNPGALAAVNEKDLERTFFSISDQVGAIAKDLQEIITDLYKMGPGLSNM